MKFINHNSYAEINLYFCNNCSNNPISGWKFLNTLCSNLDILMDLTDYH